MQIKIFCFDLLCVNNACRDLTLVNLTPEALSLDRIFVFRNPFDKQTTYWPFYAWTIYLTIEPWKPEQKHKYRNYRCLLRGLLFSGAFLIFYYPPSWEISSCTRWCASTCWSPAIHFRLWFGAYIQTWVEGFVSWVPLPNSISRETTSWHYLFVGTYYK